MTSPTLSLRADRRDLTHWLGLRTYQVRLTNAEGEEAILLKPAARKQFERAKDAFDKATSDVAQTVVMSDKSVGRISSGAHELHKQRGMAHLREALSHGGIIDTARRYLPTPWDGGGDTNRLSFTLSQLMDHNGSSKPVPTATLAEVFNAIERRNTLIKRALWGGVALLAVAGRRFRV